MAYHALLFCPDEKVAHIVSQVLGELEFSVQLCTEPFAAVKKIMAEHFDAVVVDCDNEQNATLLFKSARNSTANQAALAVAVVEGQAGVAKAFRIGANLVLTKPINVDQAKGTLRVARGLLRKGEPTKPAASAPTAAPTAGPVTAQIQATPVTPTLPPASPAVPKPSPTVTRSMPSAAPPPQATTPLPSRAASATMQTQTRPAIKSEPPAASPTPAPAPASTLTPKRTVATSPPKPMVTAAPPTQIAAPKLDSPKRKIPAAGVNAGSSGSAAATAPARAKTELELLEAPVKANTASEAEALFENPVYAERDHTTAAAPVVNPPTFTFGRSLDADEAPKGSKKPFVVIAVLALTAAALYFGWARFGSKVALPSGSHAPQDSGAPTPPPAPARSSPLTNAQPVTPAAHQNSATAAAPLPATASSEIDSAPTTNADRTTAQTSRLPTPAPASKPAAPVSTEPEVAPMVVKNGASHSLRSGTSVTDTPAPSMAGIAPAGSGDLPNLIGTESKTPRPMLQAMNVSQGVSRGLLIKKVQPVYPPSALHMRMEGSVELLATVSKEGQITAVKLLSGETVLARAATDAVKQWKYKPYLLNGEPVEIQTQITINFKLPR